jgi:hypothetical protein
MRDNAGLAPDKLATLIETAVGGLEVSNDVSTAESSRKNQEDMNLVHIVQARVEEGERNLWPLFKKMALSTEYYADNPHAAWNHDNNSVIRRPKGSRGGGQARNQHRVSFNLFKTSINAIVARFASTRPQIIVKPGSAQEDVIEAARIAQRVVGEYEWEQQAMEEVLSEATPNLVLHGTTVLKTVWNEKGGRYFGRNPVPAIAADGNPIQAQEYNPISGIVEGSVNDDGQPIWVNQMGADGKEILEDEWEGAIETSVVLARDFIVDPTAKSYRTARWVIHRYEMSPTDIYDKWGKEVGAGADDMADDRYRGWYGYNRKQEDPARSTTTVYELWLKPGTYKFGPQPGDKKTFNQGFVIICTKDRLLDSGPNPYDHGEFPFVFIPAYRIPGEIYGDSISNSLRMLQNSFNKTGAQITLANDLMGNPQWLLPNGCKMPDQDRTNRAGSYKRYESGIQGEKPEIIPGTGVSPSVWRYFDTLRSLFQEISGVREGGLGGGAPGSIESGKALNALIERDVSKLAGIGMEIGRGLKHWSWLTLQLIQQYWTHPRTVNVVGHYQMTETVSFSGVDVKDSFAMAVAPESVMPQTQGIKQAKADALLDRGLIRPYEYMRRIGEESAEEFSVEATDVANARAENASARQHGFIPIMSTPEQMEVEDHALHMEEHRRELLNPEIRRQPHKWAALYEHYQLHKEMAKAIVQEEAGNTADQMATMDPSTTMAGAEQAGPPPTPPGTTPGPQPSLGAV